LHFRNGYLFPHLEVGRNLRSLTKSVTGISGKRGRSASRRGAATAQLDIFFFRVVHGNVTNHRRVLLSHLSVVAEEQKVF
jgi:hypothetical protein